jgi:hypothetical protein
MKTNYVLIVTRSVQPDDIAALQHEHVRVFVFVGPIRQTKIAFDKAAALQRMGANAEYVQMSGSGPNASTFTLPITLAAWLRKNRRIFLHYFQRHGIRPTHKTPQGKKLRVGRVQTVGAIPILKPTDPKSSPDTVALIIEDLRKRGAADSDGENAFKHDQRQVSETAN